MAVNPELALLWEQVEELMDEIAPLPDEDPAFHQANVLDRIRCIGVPCTLLVLFWRQR